MKLSKLTIENFRSFKDQTIEFDSLTSFIGPNGVGKSTVLGALNVFFQNTTGSALDVSKLAKEDFHHQDVSKPIRIEVTFTDLSDEAKVDFKAYHRQEKLVVFSKAEWDDSAGYATVKQYGARLSHPDFARLRRMVSSKAKVSEIKDAYSKLIKEFSLPPWSNKSAAEQALQEFEEANPGLCELQDEANQFYGWSRGTNLLEKYIQWIYIPAVKDASSEQDEQSKTALGAILERTIRSKIDFSPQLERIKEQAMQEYSSTIQGHQGALREIEQGIQERFREWSNPNVSLSLGWHHDDTKAVVINEPWARVQIGEDSFVGEVARAGHGAQRALIVALLEEATRTEMEDPEKDYSGPNLLIGFEEPELYQHPPQIKYLSRLLEEMSEGRSQVIFTTHSPHLVTSRSFECIRRVVKDHQDDCTRIDHATLDAVHRRVREALGEEYTPSCHLVAQLDAIMQPSRNEMYFCKKPFLVEGVEDVAICSAYLKRKQLMKEFFARGCHFVVCGGKNNISRPLAVLIELNSEYFVLFDCDGNCKESDRSQHKRANDCLFSLLGAHDLNAFPSENTFRDTFTVWGTNLTEEIRKEVGVDTWRNARAAAKTVLGIEGKISDKNSLLLSATIEHLLANKEKIEVLDQLCERLLA